MEVSASSTRPGCTSTPRSCTPGLEETWNQKRITVNKQDAEFDVKAEVDDRTEPEANSATGNCDS